MKFLKNFVTASLDSSRNKHIYGYLLRSSIICLWRCFQCQPVRYKCIRIRSSQFLSGDRFRRDVDGMMVAEELELPPSGASGTDCYIEKAADYALLCSAMVGISR